MNFSATAKFSGLSAAAANAVYMNATVLSVSQAAEIVLEEAEAIVPVGTGALRESGHTEMTKAPTLGLVSAIVIFDVPWAAFVEYGTGLRGEGTYPFPLPTEGVPFTGGWVYDYKQQEWVGMPSQAFLRPALDISRKSIQEVFRDNIAAANKVLGKNSANADSVLKTYRTGPVLPRI